MDEPFSALDVLTAETLRTDLLDLWSEGRMPISSILLVTHNIEEAVLMSDRILVFSSNPGRVVAEIAVDLPQPRNRLDPRFRQLVDDIYARMTARPAGKPAHSAFPGTGIAMVLPRVSPNLHAGLMEILAAEPYRGHADLPALAAPLQMEIDDLFPIAETLQLLRFAEVAEGDIRLTDAGRRFVQLDPDGRKKLFAQHVLAYVPLAQHIRRVLDERGTHRRPRQPFQRRTGGSHVGRTGRPDLAGRHLLGALRRDLCLRRGDRRVQPRQPKLSGRLGARLPTWALARPSPRQLLVSRFAADEDRQQAQHGKTCHARRRG